MSKILTLASLKEEAEKKYAPTEIELSDGSIVKLSSLLRLGTNAFPAAAVGSETTSGPQTGVVRGYRRIDDPRRKEEEGR